MKKSLAMLILALMLLSPTTFAKLPTGFDLQAHRGGRDARPENTLQAFAYAMAIGVTTLEMDMQITKDGVIVIRHDNHIQYFLAHNAWGDFLTFNEMPDIRTWDFAELKKFDLRSMSPFAPYGYYDAHGKTQKECPGARLCSLEEVFQLVQAWGNKDVHLNIETKSYCYPVNPLNPDPYDWVIKFYALVRKYNMQDRVMLQSFDWRTIKIMKEMDPGIPTVALTAEQPQWNEEGDEGRYLWLDRKQPSPWMAGLDIKTFNGDYVKAAHAIKADVITPYYTELTPALIKEAHDFGMRVVPYTINNPDVMRQMITMGVDGLITDRPSIARKVLAELGIKLPAPDANPGKKPYFTGTDAIYDK